jgi:Holliday junction resolvase-like predicted endonuclease
MRPKDKGTRRETWVVRLLQDAGLDARRAPNNMPSLDVTSKSGPYALYIEVKDRGNLNLHETLAEVQNRYPSAIPHVVWHRTKKAGQRRTPVGPTLIALTIQDYAKIMSYLNHIWREHYGNDEAGGD